MPNALHARILVTGATGNVGREVVRALLGRGFPVRATGASDASGESCERVPLDFSRAETFERALHGCGAVFLLRPPAIADVRSTLNPFIDQARAMGVDHIVFLSVAGARTNRLVPHHAVEQHLIAGKGAYTILRPGFFAQNLGDAYRRDIVEDQRLYVPAGRGRVAFLAFAALVGLHGLIHLLGSSKASGWATLTQLRIPISATSGVLWTSAAVLLFGAAVGIGIGARWWWRRGCPPRQRNTSSSIPRARVLHERHARRYSLRHLASLCRRRSDLSGASRQSVHNGEPAPSGDERRHMVALTFAPWRTTWRNRFAVQTAEPQTGPPVP